MRTLIVDDEPIARQVLQEQLETFPEVLIVGEATSGMEALRKIEEAKPDLVLLDLQMPVMAGFDVIRALGGDPAPVIVVVTAYDEHAIKAFEEGAVDYLLKPVSEFRLRKAIERALALRTPPVQTANESGGLTAEESAILTLSSNRKVVGRNKGEYVLLDLDEVLAFQAEAEIVWIVTAGQRLHSMQNLRVIEDRFRRDQSREGTFQRVHRNAIVNLNHVRKLTALSSSRWLITLSNSLQLTVSKRQASNIRRLLRW